MGNPSSSVTLTLAPLKLKECLSHSRRLPRALTPFSPPGVSLPAPRLSSQWDRRVAIALQSEWELSSYNLQ